MDPTHTCFGLPARNTHYQYPQRLPVNDRISSDNVGVGFILLDKIVPPPDEACLSAVKHSLCIATNPPCNMTTGLLLSVCSDSCLAFTRIVEEGRCDSLFQYGHELLQLPSFQQGTTRNTLDLLIQFDCTNTSTYIFYDDLQAVVDPNHCTDVFTASEKGKCLCDSSPIYMATS